MFEMLDKLETAGESVVVFLDTAVNTNLSYAGYYNIVNYVCLINKINRLG